MHYLFRNFAKVLGMPHTVNAREPVFTSRDLTTLTVRLVHVVSTLAGDVGPVYTGASEAGDVGYALVDGVEDCNPINPAGRTLDDVEGCL